MTRRKSTPKKKEVPKFERKTLTPKSKNQANYMRSVYENDVTLCLGPAGVGKSAIATGLACEAILRGDVEKIIVTRPIIESGKGIGYLPGSMLEKVNPYMIPILEEMKQYLGDSLHNYKAQNAIEICPLEFMRGRNFHNTFMILDEAQNCTFEQIKMFITRIGLGSKVIINGDPEQSDLPSYTQNGFMDFVDRLDGLEGVAICKLDSSDVVRNKIIPRILERLKNA